MRRSQRFEAQSQPLSRLRRSESNSRSQPVPSTSRDSTTSSQNSESSHVTNALVENCVQALLVLHQNKQPIKKTDLSKMVFGHNGKKLKNVVEECAIILKNVYGFKLVEVPDKNVFILVNNIHVKDSRLIPRSREEYIERGMLLAVLSVIFMSGGELKEDKLFKFLEKLGFDPNSKSSIEPLNCSLKELISKNWVRQLYLKYEKVEYSEPTEYIYRWGFRAESELKKTDVLKFVCDIWGDNVVPESWRSQWAMAHQRQNSQSQNGFTQ